MPKLTDLPFQAVAKAQQYAERGSAELHYFLKMLEAGAFKLEPPQNIAAMLADIRRWGEFGMIPALNARRTPNGTAIIDDDEYCKAVSAADPELGKLRALGKNPDKDEPSGSTDETLESLVARSSGKPAPKATRHSSIIILTSGTTGTPKGANRSTPPTLAPIGGILSHVPFKSGEVTSLPAPMFHALGFLHATIAMMLGTTLVLRRRFKPVTVLEDIEKNKVTAMVVVPVMLSRILDALDGMERKPN